MEVVIVAASSILLSCNSVRDVLGRMTEFDPRRTLRLVLNNLCLGLTRVRRPRARRSPNALCGSRSKAYRACVTGRAPRDPAAGTVRQNHSPSGSEGLAKESYCEPLPCDIRAITIALGAGGLLPASAVEKMLPLKATAPEDASARMA